MSKRIILSGLALATLLTTVELAQGGETEGPVFSNPLEITNPYFPLPPLGKSMVKKLAADDGTWEYVVLSQRTRTFEYNGQTVTTREVFELEFLYEWLIEISANYFAQADDGTVYYFGEVVNVVDPAAGQEYSWLVGGATLPGDPADTLAAVHPATFMPPAPEVGMTWNPEDLAPLVVETAVVMSTEGMLVTEHATFEDCLVLYLTSDGDDAHIKYYAPGYGEIYTVDREVESSIIGYRDDM